MAMSAIRLVPVRAILRPVGPSSRASTSKWTIESDIALEERERRRQQSYMNLHASATGPRRRHWSHHHHHAAGSGSAARSMSMHTSARRASPSDDRGVPEDRLVQYAESPPAYVTIKDLTQYGTTPLSDESLIASAEFTRLELPHRLARRVLAHRSLPFIVGRNPYIAQVYQLYESSFATLSAVPPIQSLEDNVRFSKTLDELVADHAENVPTLAKGFSECKPYLDEADIATFFDRAIRNRIGIRLIAEQHLSLTFDSSPEAQSKRDQRRAKQKGQAVAGEDRFIGIVDTQCRLDKIVKSCGYHVESLCEGAYGKSPELIIDGDTAATFSYVPTHIEYVLTELLKNAFRATCDAHPDVSHANLPPVRVTISITSPSETAENRSSSSPVVTIRVRDAGGGIPPEILPKVHSYAFTTVSPGAGGEEGNPDVSSSMDDEGPGPYGMQNVGGGVGLDDTMQGMQSSTGHLAGLGFGLPLSRLHCEYFGGSLELVSLYGLGTDAFMVLRGEPAA